MSSNAHLVVNEARAGLSDAGKDRLADLRNINAARRDIAIANGDSHFGSSGSDSRRLGAGEQEELRHRGESEIAIVTPERRLAEASENELGKKKQAELAATNGLSPDQAPEKSASNDRVGYKHAIEVEPAAAVAPEQPKQAEHPFAGMVAEAKIDTSWKQDAAIDKAAQGREQAELPGTQANLAFNAEQVRQQQQGAGLQA